MLQVGATLMCSPHNGIRKCKCVCSISLHILLLSVCSLKDVIPVQLLPEVVSAPSTAGHLMAEWHRIPKGTVISVAMGDLQCSVYAAQPSVTDAGMLRCASYFNSRGCALLTKLPPTIQFV